MNFFKKILGMEDKKEEAGEKPSDTPLNVSEEEKGQGQETEQTGGEKKPKNVCEFC